MGDISTYENVLEMFKQVNCSGEHNNIFVAVKDISKGARANSTIIGGAVGGMVGYTVGMIVGESIEARTNKIASCNSIYYLINQTEHGIAILPLNGGSMLSSCANPEKLSPKFEEIMFFTYQELQDIEVKNFNMLNSRVQSVKITFADGKKIYFNVNVKEKFLPYQEECFANFMKLYKK